MKRIFSILIFILVALFTLGCFAEEEETIFYVNVNKSTGKIREDEDPFQTISNWVIKSDENSGRIAYKVDDETVYYGYILATINGKDNDIPETMFYALTDDEAIERAQGIIEESTNKVYRAALCPAYWKNGYTYKTYDWSEFNRSSIWRKF